MTRGKKRLDGTVLDRDLSLLVVVPLLDASALLGAIWAEKRGDLLGLTFAASILILLATARTRPTRLTLSLGKEFGGIVGRIAFVTFALSPLAARGDLVSFLRAGMIAVVAVPFGRAISYFLIRSLRSRGIGLEPTLIVGAGPTGVMMANALLLEPEHGLVPIGFVDTADRIDLPLPVVGPPDEIASLVARYGARRVIVAFSSVSDEDVVRFLRACDRLPVDIHIVPRFFELGVGVEETTDDIDGIPLSRLHRATHRSLTWPLKRAFDVCVAMLGIVVTSPLMAIAAISVRVSSPGPILFRQKRLGEGMKPIEIMKFRTMRINTDSDTTWSVARDERLTPVGRMLRQTHLDELPQLINVLRGDMSLVGPRPERPYFAELFSAEIPGYADRHRVPVGMTGWAQVHGLNGDTSIQKRVRFDNRYIESWSLWRDLVILTRTGAAVIGGLRLDEGEAGPEDPAVAETPAVVDLREVEIDLTAIENDGDGSGNGHLTRNGKSAAENGSENGHQGNGHRVHPTTEGPARP
jgi:exopolysaccharide biosynthesis polyprenyl glycosylphosphotransferase